MDYVLLIKYLNNEHFFHDRLRLILIQYTERAIKQKKHGFGTINMIQDYSIGFASTTIIQNLLIS